MDWNLCSEGKKKQYLLGKKGWKFFLLAQFSCVSKWNQKTQTALKLQNCLKYLIIFDCIDEITSESSQTFNCVGIGFKKLQFYWQISQSTFLELSSKEFCMLLLSNNLSWFIKGY